MRRILVYFMMLFAFASIVNAQSNLKLTGIVTDEFDHPLQGATLLLNDGLRGTSTDRRGFFVLSNLQKGVYIIQVSFLGYETVIDTLYLSESKEIKIKLIANSRQLREVVVSETANGSRDKDLSMSINVVDKVFMDENRSGSLMQTLSRIPGVSSMNIGSGQSKPMIRGLGFNRVVVAENGIKHEAQEWGADHGLEIDQMGVERIELIKGPASLIYGANAIGGVIDLKQIATPQSNSQGGTLLLNTQSNNDMYGFSARVYKRYNHFYFKTHLSLSEYADYKIPTDSIEYMSYYFHLKDRCLRNTAGKDANAGFTAGYVKNGFSSHLMLTDVYSRSGFFANAHGLEIRNSSIDYDRSTRDIELPYQQVNHLKLMSNSIWLIQDYKLNFDFAFQNNHRQEFSEKVAHGYMPEPPDSLERQFVKNSWTANLRAELPKHGMHRISTGLSAEFQQNSIDGWGFILPEFQSFTSGAYVYDKIAISEAWTLHLGARYDHGFIHTGAYYDWYETPQDGGATMAMQRAKELRKNFGSFSWGVGSTYYRPDFSVKINVGKSFRMPTAKELASNGINYHMYRYEKGDTSLHAEQSYQLDLELKQKLKKLKIEFSPFVNYFPNYIYLNPTSDYYEAQQVYYHVESRVFRTGGEFSMTYDLTKQLSAVVDAEYIYSVQLSGPKKGYTLAFSPPFSSVLGLTYSAKSKGVFLSLRMGVDLRIVAAQNNIVPPEKKTPAYQLVNMNMSTGLQLGGQVLQVNVGVQNLLNTRYYDHTSFYRLIEVPGQGRNISVGMQYKF